MIELKAPPRTGFSKSRGRPKLTCLTYGGTPAMLIKRESLREKLGVKEINKPLSWLDICYNQKLISKDLFETGKLYTRVRIHAIHNQGLMRFKSSSYLLIRHELKSPSFQDQSQKEWAEKLWNKLAKHLSATTMRDLDALLLQPINYDDHPQVHYNFCKSRLQTALEEVHYYFNSLHHKERKL